MDLPEIATLIIQHLSYQALPYYRQVCTQWNDIILQLIKYPFKRIPQVIDYYRPYRNLRKIKLWNCFIPSADPNENNTTINSFVTSVTSELKVNFPHLQTLDLREISQTSDMKLFRLICSIAGSLDLNCVKIIPEVYAVNGKLVSFLNDAQHIILKDTSDTWFPCNFNPENSFAGLNLSKSPVTKIKCKINIENFKTIARQMASFAPSVTKLDLAFIADPYTDSDYGVINSEIVSLFPNLREIKIDSNDLDLIDMANLTSNIKINLKSFYRISFNDVYLHQWKRLKYIHKLILYKKGVKTLHDYYLGHYLDSNYGMFHNITDVWIFTRLTSIRTSVDFLREHVLKFLFKLSLECEDLYQNDDENENFIRPINILHHLFKNSPSLKLKKLSIRVAFNLELILLELYMFQQQVVLLNPLLRQLEFVCILKADQTLDQCIPIGYYQYYRIYYHRETHLNMINEEQPVQIKIQMIRRYIPLDVTFLEHKKLQARQGEMISIDFINPQLELAKKVLESVSFNE